MTYQIANKPYELDKLINGLDTNVKDYFDTIENVTKGESFELYLIKILNLLELNEVHLTPRLSILHYLYQIDITVNYCNQWLGFQVVEELDHFNVHTKSSSIGVIQCNAESDSFRLLIELSKWLDAPIKDSVLDELAKWKQVKSMQIKSRNDRRLKLFKLDWQLLTLLKLVKFNGELLVY